MKQCFGYIRVSTAKQGMQGVSLQEQRAAIMRYAEQHGLTISTCFEERETAAKSGRPVFLQMLTLLKKRQADGVIIHKIDRGARNLRDWADLAELIDCGTEVHFANESLDLNSRGGRLSADIQAVVAADYIRNLREETRKGFYGRLKQGIYPLPAPLGYMNTGRGKPKQPDPMRAPLVRRLFELYASRRHTLETLQREAASLGLTNRHGGPVTRNGLSVMLNNPFYYGLIRLPRTGETFAGAHEPLIAKSLFDRVQAILHGRTPVRLDGHDFLFRRLLTCQLCGYSLIGELKKGHVYYRCHTPDCPTTGVREEQVEDAVLQTLLRLKFDAQEQRHLKAMLADLDEAAKNEAATHAAALKLRRDQLQDRLRRLTDAYLDRVIDERLFNQHKAELLRQEKDLEEALQDTRFDDMGRRVWEFLELANTAYSLYESGNCEEKRQLLEIVTSNFFIIQKNVVVELHFPFSEVEKRHSVPCGTPYRDRPRTSSSFLQNIRNWCINNPAAWFERFSGLAIRSATED